MRRNSGSCGWGQVVLLHPTSFVPRAAAPTMYPTLRLCDGGSLALMGWAASGYQNQSLSLGAKINSGFTPGL